MLRLVFLETVRRQQTPRGILQADILANGSRGAGRNGSYSIPPPLQALVRDRATYDFFSKSPSVCEGEFEE